MRHAVADHRISGPGRQQQGDGNEDGYDTPFLGGEPPVDAQQQSANGQTGEKRQDAALALGQ